MNAINPDFRACAERAFAEAAFVADMGIHLVNCGPGWCESELILTPRHLQHTGVVHAGVQTTIADHTAGAAAMTVVPQEAKILTAEFKLNLLRPGQGESLWCRAQVLKPGRMIVVVESDVFAVQDGKKVLISKLLATMAVVGSRD